MRRTFPALAFIALCFGLVLAQVTPPTYPYPKPKPTSGSTPNSLIRYSQSIGPSAYNNENPLAWAIDIAGGLHSRSNSSDRLNLSPNWTTEGALVFDASDKIFYGVGSSLVANIPLFSLDAIWNGGVINSKTNLYLNAPGANKIYLTADGIDLTGTNVMNLDGASEFTITSSNLTATATSRMIFGSLGPLSMLSTRITNSAGDYIVKGTNKIQFQTKKVLDGTARLGQALKLMNPDGDAEFGPAEVGFITVTNVAQLLTTPTDAFGYDKAMTLGYYTINDGGGGMYYVAPFFASSTNRGNFRSTFDPTKMWALLQPRDGIYLKQYGAKGDENNDDTQAVKDWLHDINGKVGLINVGTYSIQPIYTEANALLTLRGIAKFGLTSANLVSGLSSGNCATFQRRASAGLETNSLLTVTSNAVCNVFNLVFDGNKNVETLATNAYLYLNNGGKASELESCFFYRSAGHGLGFAGLGPNWSVVRNCRIADVNRGLRINQTSGLVLNNINIEQTRDNGFWLLGSATSTRANNLFIAHCASNGMVLEISYKNRFTDVTVANTWQSSVLFALGNGSMADNHFVNCRFEQAGSPSNLNGASPHPAGTYSMVMVTSPNATDNAVRIRFSGCTFGDVQGAAGSRSRYNFEWTAGQSGGHYAWENWIFAENQYMWNANWISDYSPALTNVVAETATIHANNQFYNVFGAAGKIDSAGWRMDIVEAGTTGGANAVIYANNTSHKLLRDTAGFGTPVQLIDPPPPVIEVSPAPFQPEIGPIPDP
jgi:hypothetical protein